MIFVLRSPRPAGEVMREALASLSSVDGRLPAFAVRPLGELVSQSLAQRTFALALVQGFALIALLLAAIGLYGVLSYSVAGRTREIGVRMALGAQRGSVLNMVLREAGKLVVLGIVIGVPAAMLAGRLFSSMLFGLKATDPLSMVLVVAILLAITLLASYIPARRATKVDPIIALRYE